jgi:hypothetical protein
MLWALCTVFPLNLGCTTCRQVQYSTASLSLTISVPGQEVQILIAFLLRLYDLQASKVPGWNRFLGSLNVYKTASDEKLRV